MYLSNYNCSNWLLLENMVKSYNLGTGGGLPFLAS